MLLKTSTLLLFMLSGLLVLGQEYQLQSPDGNLRVVVTAENQPSWSVYQNETLIMGPVEIGMMIDGTILGLEGNVVSAKSRTVDQIITSTVPLKFREIRDHFNELSLVFENDYSVEFRAFNNGVAHRFVTSVSGQIEVEDELMKFSFPEGSTAYFPEEEGFISHNERLYSYEKLDTMSAGRFCSLPVLFNVGDTHVLFTEADLYDYPGLFVEAGGDGHLKAIFPNYVEEAIPMEGTEDRNEVITKEAPFIAKTNGDRSFPWRVIVIGDDADLLESTLVFQLSRPLQLENTDWIKPGKVAWDWYNANNIYGVDFEAGLNTETYKYYIDFASAYGLEYVILDEGWTRTTTDTKAWNPDIDVRELIAYGKEKNVGIILWTLWKPLNEDYENILKLYRDWGAKGIKVDFMQRNDQEMVRFYEKIAAEAAKNQLLVDYHGAFKPMGLRRAYPNVISYEGVKGNENNKWSADVTPEHDLILPFTRMVAGPMDYTPGAMTNATASNHRISHYRPMSLGTRAHEMAMYVVFESPLQMLCDAPTLYMQHPELTQLISKIPTVWDETIALEAEVAGHVLMARRKGDTWYVGAMTDWDGQELLLDLSFLPEGDYDLAYIADGVNAHQHAEDYEISSMKVRNSDKIPIKLAQGGGWVAIITRDET